LEWWNNGMIEQWNYKSDDCVDKQSLVREIILKS